MKNSAFRVGAFVVVGLAVLVISITYVLGGQLLTRHLDVEMRFAGSVYGLQVGSPVVFRGVRIGRVSDIGLAYDDQQGQILIPVAAMIDQAALQRMVPSPSAANGSAAEQALKTLIAQGLSARLATQSLLTGQLYVDLDLRPAMVGQGEPGFQPPRIATMPTTIQAAMAQIEELDLKGAFQDLAGLAASTRQLVGDPQLRRTVGNVAELSAELRTLTRSLQQQVQPLSSATQETLTQARQSAVQLQATMAPESPLVKSFQRAADELANTAAQLRQTTGEDAVLVRQLERAATDVARTARQLGDLARLLEQQPDALLRGRQPPTPP